MKVLHVINSLGAGGAEKLLVSFLANNDGVFEHELCLLYRTREADFASLAERGIPVHQLNFSRKYHFRITCRLWQLIARGQYDLVHVHLFPAQYFVAAVAFFVRRPVYIFTEHNSYNRRRAWRFFKYLDYLSYLPYRKVIGISQTAEKDLHRWLPSLASKTTVIYNGVPIRPGLQLEQIYDLVLVGSLRSRVKGVDLLLASLAQLGSVVGKVAIAGDGVCKPELIRQREELGLEGQVDFLGNVADIHRLLASSKIFVMPSRWEGLPIALLEAMAAGKPVIASRVGGIPELIEHNRNGWLIPPEDVAALVQAIETLLANPELSARLGLQALADIRGKYSIEVYIQQIHNLYHRMLGNKSGESNALLSEL